MGKKKILLVILVMYYHTYSYVCGVRENIEWGWMEGGGGGGGGGKGDFPVSCCYIYVLYCIIIPIPLPKYILSPIAISGRKNSSNILVFGCSPTLKL